MSIFNVISLAGGLSLFLFGMRLMGDGLKQGSSETMRTAMGKVTNSPVTSFLLGMGITGLIQSSTATIVLTSGLVGAGVMTLHQSLGIILGANVGTTVTGQIIRLLDVNSDGTAWLEFFKPSTLAPLAALIGILLIMVSKNQKHNTAGSIFMGFGILFTGLLNMTAAVSPLSDSPAFTNLFVGFADRPLLGCLAGCIVAVITQSSSASVGILQALSMTGRLSLGSVYSIILGIYMGDCITTAIVCSLGAKADARRTGIVHILVNMCGLVLIPAVLYALKGLGVLGSFWSDPITSGEIANVHTVFKLGLAVVMLPFVGYIEKLSMHIVRGDKEKAGKYDDQLRMLDRALLSSPALALEEAHRVLIDCADAACANVELSMGLFTDFDLEHIQRIREEEDRIDALTDAVQGFLVKLSPNIGDGHQNNLLNYYIKCSSEFERVGDYAVNLVENAEELNNLRRKLSDDAVKELEVLNHAIQNIMDYTVSTFRTHDAALAFHIEPLEEVIDDLVAEIKQRHILRLRQQECNVETGSVYLDLLVNAERISDQCSNVGIHTMAIDLPDLSIHEHDYIHELHHGENERFNREYDELHSTFFSEMKGQGAD